MGRERHQPLLFLPGAHDTRAFASGHSVPLGDVHGEGGPLSQARAKDNPLCKCDLLKLGASGNVWGVLASLGSVPPKDLGGVDRTHMCRTESIKSNQPFTDSVLMPQAGGAGHRPQGAREAVPLLPPAGQPQTLCLPPAVLTEYCSGSPHWKRER